MWRPDKAAAMCHRHILINRAGLAALIRLICQLDVFFSVLGMMLYLCICSHMDTHTRTCTHTSKHTHVHAQTHTHTRAHVRAHTRTHKQTHTHSFTHAHAHTHSYDTPNQKYLTSKHEQSKSI